MRLSMAPKPRTRLRIEWATNERGMAGAVPGPHGRALHPQPRRYFARLPWERLNDPGEYEKSVAPPPTEDEVKERRAAVDAERKRKQLSAKQRRADAAIRDQIRAQRKSEDDALMARIAPRIYEGASLVRISRELNLAYHTVCRLGSGLRRELWLRKKCGEEPDREPLVVVWTEKALVAQRELRRRDQLAMAVNDAKWQARADGRISSAERLLALEVDMRKSPELLIQEIVEALAAAIG